MDRSIHRLAAAAFNRLSSSLRMHQLVNKVIAQQHVKCNNEAHTLVVVGLDDEYPGAAEHILLLICDPGGGRESDGFARRQKSFIAIRPPFFNQTDCVERRH